MNWGIFTLMGVLLTVLTGITLFFVHIVRKEEAAINAPQPNRLAGLTSNRVEQTCRSARTRGSTSLPGFRGSTCGKLVRGNL